MNFEVKLGLCNDNFTKHFDGFHSSAPGLSFCPIRKKACLKGLNFDVAPWCGGGRIVTYSFHNTKRPENYSLLYFCCVPTTNYAMTSQHYGKKCQFSNFNVSSALILKDWNLHSFLSHFRTQIKGCFSCRPLSQCFTKHAGVVCSLDRHGAVSFWRLLYSLPQLPYKGMLTNASLAKILKKITIEFSALKGWQTVGLAIFFWKNSSHLTEGLMPKG